MNDDHGATPGVVVASLVLYAADIEQTGDFYRALGFDLSESQHDDSPVHLVTTLGPDVHFAIYPALGLEPVDRPAWEQAGSSLPGVWVDDLDGVTATLHASGHLVAADHQARSWGCRIVVVDPDGRSIEINQRDHCGLLADHP